MSGTDDNESADRERTADGLNRRSVLKRGGAVAATMTGAGVGTSSASDHADLTIKVLPATWRVPLSMKDHLSNVREAIEVFMEDVSRRIGLNDYSIDIMDSTLKEWSDSYEGKVSDCGGPKIEADHTLEIEFEDHLSTSADLYVIVTEQSSFAGVVKQKVWEDGCAVAWAGVSPDYPTGDLIINQVERYKNGAIQETAHTLIDHDVAIGGTGDNGEHKLGKINYDGSSTPLISFYQTEWSDECNPGDVHVGEGECSTGTEWDGSFDRHVTDCTLDAIEQTYLEHGF